MSAPVRSEFDTERAPGSRFRGLLDAAPDAIVAVDDEGRILLVNRQAERLFGYDRRELVGESVEVLVPRGARGRHPSHRQSYLLDPRPREMGAGMLLSARRRDGSEFPAEISLNAVETDDGRIVAAAIRDVSQRQRAEAIFRGLLDAAPDAIVGVDADGLIQLINAQTERLFGREREELIGRPVEILVPGGAKAIHADDQASHVGSPSARARSAGMRLEGVRKDASRFPAEISRSTIETEEGLLALVAIRDVTERIEAQAEHERLVAQAERQRLESQLHQAQRLESLGQLAGGIAHDFNNLLGVISNYAAFVADEIGAVAATDPGRWEHVRDDITEIQRAAERAARLTHQLLTFGRREVVQPRVVSLNTVVLEVERLLRRALGEHIQLITHLADDLLSVMADPGQLEQVIVNLAVNARDAMPGGGKLVIETVNVEGAEGGARGDLDVAQPVGPPGAGRVMLRVSDTGVGMSEEVIERAFEPFFTTKSKGEGTGLGLATVYGIVTQAGGDVQIYSEPGRGTSVVVLLPSTAAATPVVEERARHAGPRGGETVLVVEDQDALREVTRRILARNGYDVIVARRGEDAIEQAQLHPRAIDLLVTDVVMPQMLGKEVAEHISLMRPHIRVLYMSGYAQPVLASQGTLDPGVNLIEKPFSEEQLLTKVREVLDAAGVGDLVRDA